MSINLMLDDARYRQLFEEHTAVKLLIDPSNGAIVDANPAACAFYGYSREQMTAMRISDINMLSPEAIAQEMARAAVREHNYFVFPHRLASGDIRTVEVHSGPVHVGDKHLLYSIIHDITERTEAEAALKKRTEQLRLLHDAGRLLSQSLDLNVISDTLYRVVSGMMDCDVLILSEYNPGDNLIRCVHWRYEGEIKDATELPPVPLNPDGRGTQSIAIRTGQSLLLNDYLAHMRTAANVYYYDGKNVSKADMDAVEADENITRSGLIVPLKLEKEVIGVVQVLSYRLNAYDEDDLWLLESLASHVAIADKNAALYRHVQEELAERRRAEAELKKRTEQLRLLHEAGRQLSQSLDLNIIFDTLYHLISGVVDCDSLLLSRYNPEDNLIRCVYLRHEGQVIDPSELPPIPLEPEGRGTQSIAIRTGKSLLLNDYQAYVRTATTSYYFDKDKVFETQDVQPEEADVTRSALIVPLTLEGQVIGVVQVFSYHLNAYDEDDLWLLESLAAHVAIADKNASLYRHIQEELAERRRAEEKFRIIFDESPEVILIVSTDGLIQRVNRAVHSLLGYDESALIGQHFTLLLPGGETTAVNWRDTINDASRRSGTFDFLRADGTTLSMDWSVTFIPWEGGQAILSTLADATERRLLEKERLNAEVLRLQIQQEREFIELREQFINTISHEFRTPLAIIQSSSELLERYHDRLSVSRRTEHLHEVQKQVRHMTEMLEDFLHLSKMRSGRGKFHPEPIAVASFCRAIISRVQRTASDRHRLQFTSDGDYENVLVDGKLLSHILTNLLSNAVKYSPNGGDIHLHLFSEADDLVFQISDQGIGIPEADQPRLFEPFERGSNVKRIEGTGLGLAVVKNSVMLHDGSIELQSKEGEGTVFTVRLPRAGTTTG